MVEGEVLSESSSEVMVIIKPPEGIDEVKLQI